MESLLNRPHGILDAAESGSDGGGPRFTLAHRAERALFIVVWTILARWTPPPLHRWRIFVLRAFGARLANNVRIYASTRVWYPRNLIAEDNATIGPGAIIYSMAAITIGANAVVSQRAHLCAGTHDVDEPNFPLIRRPIAIGPKAWVAAEAFVGPGVAVGEGAVLGARSVTVKALEPWMIYVGNPARAVRRRKPH